ncbi:MAG TPA: DUF6580 family putative transport protein [Isosphaeraceae bacterium]|jgi:hypothetical protein|nr:DUF6580 family putative transport protein [Isosphaeraceae bacterium]
MPTALFLIAVGALTRIVPHPPNAVPMGALALYAGARLPRRWAWTVPVAAMALSDLVMDLFHFYAWTGFDPARLVSYATFAAIAALGHLPRREAGSPTWTRMATWSGMSLLASTLFFVTSNLASWRAPEIGYPATWAGLVACFTLAIPFFPYTLLADLAGTTLLFFGLDPLRERLLRARKASAEGLATDLD